MRMVVTAAKATVYGKTMVTGEEFDCPEKEAKLWSSLARAMPAGGKVKGGRQLDLGERANDQAETQGRRQSRQGKYDRRDMRAED